MQDSLAGSFRPSVAGLISTDDMQAENTNQTRKLRAIITILYHMVYQHSSDQRVVDIEPRQKVTLGTYYVRENCGIDKVSVDSAYFLKQ